MLIIRLPIWALKCTCLKIMLYSYTQIIIKITLSNWCIYHRWTTHLHFDLCAFYISLKEMHLVFRVYRNRISWTDTIASTYGSIVPGLSFSAIPLRCKTLLMVSPQFQIQVTIIQYSTNYLNNHFKRLLIRKHYRYDIHFVCVL